MHFNIAEVVPAAGAAAELLGPILALSALVFVLGCVVMLDGFVRGLFGGVAALFSHIPLIGSATEAAIHKAEQAISNALGTAVAGIENRIAMQWHNLARAADKLWDYQVNVAENLWHLTQSANSAVSQGDLRHLLRKATAEIDRAGTFLQNEIRHAERRAISRVESLGHSVIPRIRALEHTIAVTIPKEIKSARDLAREAENGVARLWDRVRAIEASTGAAAIAAVVATVLAAIGLDWLACRDGAKRAGKSGCDLWDEIGALLGLAGALLAFSDLEELLKVAEEIEGDVITLARDALNIP